MGQAECFCFVAQQEEMAWAMAVAGAETGDGDRHLWLRRQIASPDTLQVLLGSQPEGSRSPHPSQDINMPVRTAVPSQVPGEAGPQAARPPGAAHIEVTACWEGAGPQRAHDKVVYLIEAEGQRVGAGLSG